MNAVVQWRNDHLRCLSITAVENSDGQSILEFLMMLPMLLGLVAILIKVNTAIQISIVNQQYARAQALFLTYNSSIYPKLDMQPRLIDMKANQFILGVSDNAGGAGEGNYTPKATVQNIARTKHIQGSNASGEEPTKRSLVRIRNTVTLCTPSLFVGGGKGVLPILALNQGGKPSGEVNLSEGTKLDNFCESQVKYEQ